MNSEQAMQLKLDMKKNQPMFCPNCSSFNVITKATVFPVDMKNYSCVYQEEALCKDCGYGFKAQTMLENLYKVLRPKEDLE